MRHRLITTCVLASAAALSACDRGDGFEQASESITAAALGQGIQDLAADSMGGRAPATWGEERTVRLLRERFESLGLEPGNGASWVQEVPLVSLTPDPDMGAVVRGRGTVNRLQHASDFVAVTERVAEAVELDASELVFVGYGIVAPEFGWNDYEGVDVTGRTVVVLVNDPGYATGDETLFNGRAMTYYGRWTYKYEEAARQGADGVFIVHQTGPAGYPWSVVEAGWTGPQFMLAEAGDAPLAKVQGWVSEETARTVFAQARLDFDARAAQASTREFAPYEMGLSLSLTVRNSIERSTSRNVLALLPGSERPEEFVIYTAHWDHLGTDPSLGADSIYNGALDNASGTSGLLEMAEAFTALRKAPARSVLFMAVTAEEQGLLGTAYYAAHPVYPLDATVATINMDGLNIWGPTSDITVVGFGMSELDDVLRVAADASGRTLAPDPEPEKGSYFRSDHFEFAKRGVPSLYPKAGVQDFEHGEEWARERREEYTRDHYHKPSDEYDPAWNLDGAIEDLRLMFAVGHALATGESWPNWREGTEFKALRDGMMGYAPPAAGGE
ncbi:MAG: M28 family metallopeptidase [marine benthic group bacterium]|nr:M28 family metallopeptidase [Candidatus Benthicola marisminoris]